MFTKKLNLYQALGVSQVRIDSSILLMFHCEQNTGYAIETLEKVFYRAAISAGYTEENIYWSFKSVSTINSKTIACDYKSPNESIDLKKFIVDKNILTVIAFDLGFPCPVIGELKEAGVTRLVSYWGASMSSINHGLKLALKKLECCIRKNKPDEFIFESEAMRSTGTQGRGLNPKQTHVVYLGVDTDKFHPNYGIDSYTHESLKIPSNRRIIFYSGHMEERKGVRVIIKSAIHLIDQLKQQNFHFVICGNKNNEAASYLQLLDGTEAKKYVTFAGYRADINLLMRGSDMGVIASTGWDSFTMSSVEMMASGLPMIVSNLQGLSETIVHGENGFLFEPGNYVELATLISNISATPELAQRFSAASRNRAVKLFSQKSQIKDIADILQRI
jgi:glycosyltransferase involved in cell wall biosynthesis